MLWVTMFFILSPRIFRIFKPQNICIFRKKISILGKLACASYISCYFFMRDKTKFLNFSLVNEQRSHWLHFKEDYKGNKKLSVPEEE